ncbi:MAG: Cu(I)/Ag(I) efflux system membrane fusion protein [Rickettsiales bacterium]|jgi:Cu(I)/Ag(I) efflux system membrane fusion protein
MKKKITIAILAASLIIFGILAVKQFTSSNDIIFEKKAGYYTCSMHPQIRENESGRCPICGMNLTYVENAPNHQVHNNSEHQKTPSKQEENKPMQMVQLTPKQVDNFHSTTFVVQKQKILKTLRLLGKVVQSEKTQSNIPARVSGRVEKSYINSTGSFISKNDPAVDIYSPDLITTGEEYLISYQSGQKDLLKQAKKKLELWGIKDFQIKEWLKNGKIPRNITIYANNSGIVTKKNAIEGRYFKEGESFYDLVNLSTVWVEMDVYEHDSGLIKMGLEANIEFVAHKGEKWTANLDFISPILDENSRTLKVRTTIKNKDGKLKPGMVGQVHIVADSTNDVLVVPNSAIIDTGNRKIIWLEKDANSYMAIEIQTGIEGSEFTQVKSGLKEGDAVVMSGNFLLDAQSQLSGNNVIHSH